MKKVPINNYLRYAARKINPIPSPPKWQDYEDICKVELVPHEKLVSMYKKVISDHWFEAREIVHLEFGVFNGTSLSAAYYAYQELQLNFKIIAFDSFQGLPNESCEDDLGAWKPGEYYCSRAVAENCLIGRGVNLDQIEIVEGWYSEILNDELKDKLKLIRADVVFIDCDTYLSSKAVLDFISPLIEGKILICLDDWRLHDLDLYELGEKKAFSEFMSSRPDLISNQIKSYNRKSQSFIVTKEK